MKNNKINEDLKRFNSLIGYDPSKGVISEAKMRRPAPGYLTEDEPEEDFEGEEEFDFGGEEDTEGGEEDTGDFDFGDEGSPEEGEDTEGEEDQFGTASEFSAADDLEMAEEDVEEIDVTSLVKGSEEAKEAAQQAVNLGQENTSYLKALTDKLSNLESQLSKMDSIANKVSQLQQTIKTPEEKLELRSLDSFPFNQKLSDYWEDKAKTDDRYRISTGEETSDGQTKEFVLNKDEIESDYSEETIKSSFNPNK